MVLRRCTGQPTEEEKVKEQKQIWAARDAKELAKASGGGGGGGGGFDMTKVKRR